jgi:thioredoxin 1
MSTPTKARARAEALLRALADVDAIAIGISKLEDSNETNWKQQVKILIEVFAAPGCSKCARKRQALRAVTEELAADRFDWHDINPLENIERAVELGVMSPLSLVIDAELVFPALPTPERLRAELARRSARPHTASPQ